MRHIVFPVMLVLSTALVAVPVQAAACGGTATYTLAGEFAFTCPSGWGGYAVTAEDMSGVAPCYEVDQPSDTQVVVTVVPACLDETLDLRVSTVGSITVIGF